MRADSSILPPSRRRINHRPRTRRPQTARFVIVSERIRRRSSVHFLIVPVIKLPLPRLTASSRLRDPPNAHLPVPASTVRSRIGILQSQLLLLVVAVVGFISHASVPRLVGVQSAESASIPSSSLGSVGCRLVGSACCALVAQSVPFVENPALDSAGGGRGRAVRCRVAVGAVEGVEVGGWEAEAARAVV